MGPLLKPAQALPVPQFCQSQQEFDENQFESYYVGKLIIFCYSPFPRIYMYFGNRAL